MEEMEIDQSSTIVEEDNDDQWVDGDDIFSEESSFYGSERTKAEYVKRVEAYDPESYWHVVQWNIQCLAAQAASDLPKGFKRKREDGQDSSQSSILDVRTNSDLPMKTRSKGNSSRASPRPYNPYEGDQSAKQLSETVGNFVSRLPPSMTSLTTSGPWIWVANPYSTWRPTNEDVAGFKGKGLEMLAEYRSRKSELQAQHPKKAQSAITRMLNTDRDALGTRILDLARQHGVTSGKWMLFPPPEEVDGIWLTVVKAVVSGELGCGAKVATNDGNSKGKYRLLCVYTSDFSDTRDVERILGRMRELGLVGSGNDRSQTVYYKCDAYTHLDIANGNEYKLKASMYNSRDIGSGGSA